MDLHGAMIGPRTALSALQALRDSETLAAYIGVCPTCLGWEDPEAERSERTASAGRPLCPTCGLCSIEWDLSVAIDEQLDRMTTWAELDAAVRESAD